ncbi:hypothetical protein CJU89_4160 [Yarrowia sp. B02]|nr:hypothetical protein CJU89_4160 [Yarrowia sp. B02]
MATLDAIPEFLETTVGESITARTNALAAFKELGPPDLVHLTKVDHRGESGTYHYVIGVDVSSAASVAVHLNQLTYSLGEEQLWFGKPQTWKITQGLLCSFNAFTKCDVRIIVKIPGGVESYFVDPRGERHSMTDQVWLETYMSAMIRSLLFADDDTFLTHGCLKLRPLPLKKKNVLNGDSDEGDSSKKDATSLPNSIPDSDDDVYLGGDFFLDTFERLFGIGPLSGACSEIQVPTLVNNYLVDAFMAFMRITRLYDRGLEIVRHLQTEYPEVVSLIARIQLLMDEEVEAVRTMVNGLKENGRDADLLSLQAEFLLSKNREDMALGCATRAVNSAPSESKLWTELVQVYIRQKDWENALLTLNSCPMFTYHEHDQHRMPAPAKSHYPLPLDGILKDVYEASQVDQTEEHSQIDPKLLKLPAPNLRATFAKVYEHLTAIVHEIGWDQLLEVRSRVFVMDEEYKRGGRSDKSGDKSQSGSASTAAIPPASATPSVAGSSTAVNNLTAPETSHANVSSTSISAPQFRHKRLCERWLDNLFMVLYEDLKVYTVWRAEMLYSQSENRPFEKHALEWEILGLVAFRLRHYNEAVDAFMHSLSARFSARVCWKLLQYYSDVYPEQEKQLAPQVSKTVARVAEEREIDVLVRLVSFNHRCYSVFSVKLIEAYRKLVDRDGLVKIQNRIRAIFYDDKGVLELVNEVFQGIH